MDSLSSDVAALCETFYEDYSAVESKLFTLPKTKGKGQGALNSAILVSGHYEITSLPPSLLPIVQQAVALSQTSVSTPETLTLSLPDASYDVAPIPLGGGIIVVRYDKPGEDDVRTRLMYLAGLLPNRIKSATNQDLSDRHKRLTSSTTEDPTAPRLLIVDNQNVYLLPSPKKGYVFPYVADDDRTPIPVNSKFLLPSPGVISDSHDISQLFRTYLPGVQGKNKVCSNVSVVPLGDGGFLISPDFSFELALNADLSTTATRAVAQITPSLTTAAETLNEPLVRAQTLRALEEKALVSERTMKLGQTVARVVDYGAEQISKRTAFQKLQLTSCQSKVR